MADDTFRVSVVMEVEPEVHSHSELGGLGTPEQTQVHATTAKAEGTRVEVENTGDVIRFNPDRFGEFDGTAAEFTRRTNPDDLQESLSIVGTRWLPVSGGHIDFRREGDFILVNAIGGGNQTFDRWAQGPCEGQGAHCEMAPPPPGEDRVVLWVYFKAQDIPEVVTPVQPGAEFHQPLPPTP